MSEYNFKHVINNIPQGYIAKSNIHGYGLFANNNILKNTVLVTLDGQLIDWVKYHQLIDILGRNRDRYTDPLFLEWNCLGNKNYEKDVPEKTRLLVRPLRTKYSFVNHSREPNCTLIRKDNILKLVTIKNIRKDEEFTFDYRIEPLPNIYYEEHGNSFL